MARAVWICGSRRWTARPAFVHSFDRTSLRLRAPDPRWFILLMESSWGYAPQTRAKGRLPFGNPTKGRCPFRNPKVYIYGVLTPYMRMPAARLRVVLL